ncbi:MAG TPA: hypothetical protein VFM93_10380 [Candidatus Limnocylindria bacterium]|nr:hypothetical protein [Candidatus Limnocylindria bacterium]
MEGSLPIVWPSRRMVLAIFMSVALWWTAAMPSSAWSGYTGVTETGRPNCTNICFQNITWE